MPTQHPRFRAGGPRGTAIAVARDAGAAGIRRVLLLKSRAGYSDARLVLILRGAAEPLTSWWARPAFVFGRVEQDAQHARAINYHRLRVSSDCARHLHAAWRQLTLRGLLRTLVRLPILDQVPLRAAADGRGSLG